MKAKEPNIQLTISSGCDCDDPVVTLKEKGFCCGRCDSPYICDICYDSPSPKQATIKNHYLYVCGEYCDDIATDTVYDSDRC